MEYWNDGFKSDFSLFISKSDLFLTKTQFSSFPVFQYSIMALAVFVENECQRVANSHEFGPLAIY